MHLAYTPEQEALQRELRTYFAGLMTPEVEAECAAGETGGPACLEAVRTMGRDGWLGIGWPTEYGGQGRTDVEQFIFFNEAWRAGAPIPFLSINTVGRTIMEYGTEEQKQFFLPRILRGELHFSIGYTEPNAGTDLASLTTKAVKDGDEWVINGQKTFITNGIHSDLVIVVARTDPNAGSKGFSLFVVERGMPGFGRGRKLHKVGLAGQDTAELVFEDVRVPATNLLGTEGRGFVHLMENLPLERISIAVNAIAAAKAAYQWTRDYVFERKAFGKPIGDLQNTRFALAEMLTEIEVTESHIDRCVLALNAGELTAVDASKGKWWASELQKRVVDRCVQLHGGYGYMMEYPIGRAYVDSRIQTIYGGTTEIMKEIIGRDIASQ